QQVHTCHHQGCQKVDWRTGLLICKQWAPWSLAPENVVDKVGNWYPKHTFRFINNYNPYLLVSLQCNHDIKLLTNDKDTRNVCWYIMKYTTKNQQKLSNISALLAKGLVYHFSDNKYVNSVQDHSCLIVRVRPLLFR
ncbi:hypothetical protein BS47DRAFT_1306869, partial [Hydnum rufescens UP504]